MNSRERVRAVLNRQIPDYVPNGWGGCETAGLHVLAYEKLQKVLGVPAAAPRVDTFMVNAVFEEDVIAAMQGDIILVASPLMCKSALRGDVRDQWKDQTLWGRTFRVPVKDTFRQRPDGTVVWETCRNVECPSGSYFFDSAGGTDLLEEFEFPDPDDYHPPMEIPEQTLRSLEETCRRLYEDTEYCLCMGESITDLQIQPGGMIGSMVLMKEEPEVMQEFLEKSLQAGVSQLRQLDQAIGKYTDILSIAHDFGDNQGITIGAALWRELYRPFYQRLFRAWHEITDMKVNLHSCGAVSEILDDLITCGVDLYNPVQISARGMDPAELKARFGDRLIFWGGAYDAQKFCRLPEEEVYRQVRDTVSVFKEGGGYIFSGVHNLPADVPEGHLKAMLEAYYAVRMY